MAALILVFSTNAAALAGPLHLVIPSEVSVQSDVIVLGDLLPTAAPRDLRNLASKIDLGPAPHLGALRHISRSSILSALDSADLPSSVFAVPDSVAVRRTAHRISRKEVLAAVSFALRKSPNLSSVDLSTLALDAAVDVPISDPRLEVTQTDLDVPLSRIRFRLVAKAAPSVVPFLATARLTSDSTPAISRFIAKRTSESATLTAAARPVLIPSDRPAELHMHSANSDLRLTVKPLQRGRFGETIRVQVLGSQKILKGRVIAPGLLDAAF